MIIECSMEGGTRLTEPFDFHRFKLVIRGETCGESFAWQGVDFVDDHNALVCIELIPTLDGCPDDKSWEPAFAEMVEKARAHGWIDQEANAIRAHVERQP
jgi:hypothetical protein